VSLVELHEAARPQLAQAVADALPGENNNGPAHLQK